MHHAIKSALQSVRVFSYNRRIHSLDGRYLPGQLLGVWAPPEELRATARKIISPRPLWVSVKESLIQRAAELETLEFYLDTPIE